MCQIDEEQIKNQGKKVLEIEAQAVNNIKRSINGQFVKIVEEILACEGRVIMTGMGKSGFIAKKLAATLSSTGTPSFFLHPAEAIHGDLGMVTETDIVIAISNSGETEEVLNILPVIKRIGAKVIAFTGDLSSTLATNADYLLDSGVQEEACPMDLAPTASTTATLALGDSLAMVLVALRNFEPKDFALYHPGGSLGKKLLLTVDDVLHVRERNPIVTASDQLKEVLFTMTSTGTGAASVVDDQGQLVGIIADGDIRRKLEQSPNLLHKKAAAVMTSDPITIMPNKLAAEALKIMQDNDINDLPVVDENSQPLGLIDFQDLLKAGVL